MLARAMESEGLPLATMVQGLENLSAGQMGEALGLLEKGQKAEREALAGEFRNQSLPVQDKIIAELEAMLARLQRNEQARQALKRMEQKDKTNHKNLTNLLTQMIKDLDSLLKDQTELAGKFDETPTPHRFRHTFARILLQRGVPVADVADLLGDDEKTVREHYSRWVPERQARLTKILKEAFDDKPKPKLVAIRAGARERG